MPRLLPPKHRLRAAKAPGDTENAFNHHSIRKRLKHLSYDRCFSLPKGPMKTTINERSFTTILKEGALLSYVKPTPSNQEDSLLYACLSDEEVLREFRSSKKHNGTFFILDLYRNPKSAVSFIMAGLVIREGGIKYSSADAEAFDRLSEEEKARIIQRGDELERYAKAVADMASVCSRGSGAAFLRPATSRRANQGEKIIFQRVEGENTADTVFCLSVFMPATFGQLVKPLSGSMREKRSELKSALLEDLASRGKKETRINAFIRKNDLYLPNPEAERCFFQDDLTNLIHRFSPDATESREKEGKVNKTKDTQEASA